MIPDSERPHYDAAVQQVREADERILPRPQVTDEQLAEMAALAQQARIVLREAPGLLDHLEQRGRHLRPPGSATASEAALYRAGYLDLMYDVRDIATWEPPDG